MNKTAERIINQIQINEMIEEGIIDNPDEEETLELERWCDYLANNGL